ncbi:MAG: DNA recombination protein RmuC [Erysipelotrichaceae bacterium]|nr:DNA recombination protein RmuC [Erysipelotrichaceae bacterium]
MQKDQLIILSSFLVLVVVILITIIIIYLIKDNQKRQELLFKEEINKMTMTVDNIYKQLDQNLSNNRESNYRAFKDVSISLAKIEKSQEGLNSIGDGLDELKKIFIDKKHRGQFGEIELYSILNADFGLSDELYQKQYHLKNGNIVDCMVFGLGDYGHLPIDSKFPLENYLKMLNANNNPEEYRRYAKQFKNDIIKHLNDIHDKYVVSDETCDFALMFLPSEAIYAEIYAHHQDLVNKSFNLHVFFTSPSTLIAYLSAYKNLHIHYRRTNEIKHIQDELALLAVDFGRFTKRYEAITKDFEKTYNDFKELNISTNKIIKRFERIDNVELKDENHG